MAEKEIKIEYDSDSKKLTFFRMENEDWQEVFGEETECG